MYIPSCSMYGTSICPHIQVIFGGIFLSKGWATLHRASVSSPSHCRPPRGSPEACPWGEAIASRSGGGEVCCLYVVGDMEEPPQMGNPQ